MNENTVRCKACNSVYVILPFYSGDQSMCPKCINTSKAVGKNFNLQETDPNILFNDVQDNFSVNFNIN